MPDERDSGGKQDYHPAGYNEPKGALAHSALWAAAGICSAALRRSCFNTRTKGCRPGIPFLWTFSLPANSPELR
jgi:hypothetical protein